MKSVKTIYLGSLWAKSCFIVESYMAFSQNSWFSILLEAKQWIQSLLLLHKREVAF